MSAHDQGRLVMTHARLAALIAFRSDWRRALSPFEVSIVVEAMEMSLAGRTAAITDPMVEVLDRSWAAIVTGRGLCGHFGTVIIDEFAGGLMSVNERRGYR